MKNKRLPKSVRLHIRRLKASLKNASNPKQAEEIQAKISSFKKEKPETVSEPVAKIESQAEIVAPKLTTDTPVATEPRVESTHEV